MQCCDLSVVLASAAHTSLIAIAAHVSVVILLVLRVLMRPHREPASRIAWIVVMISLPVVGIIAYLLMGEVSIGRKRIERMQRVLYELPEPASAKGADAPEIRSDVPEHFEPLYSIAKSINGFRAIAGNTASLMADSNATIEALVADIDNATDHVHVCFYIWLTDNNGRKVAEALKRAAARGVTCRAMADGLGSRAMIKSDVWNQMRQAGVKLGVALPIGNPLLRPLHGRIDLRNHRKNVVIDDWITYSGSQNCADPEFRVKPKFAPWVDTMIRIVGPVARQNQYLFASDWMESVDEDISDYLRRPFPRFEKGFTAQAFGTGPTVRYSAMPEMFESTIYAARHDIVITTPYYVPTESMQGALCACARRGVDTLIVFPARNDSWFVAAASRSCYADLLEAGVRIHEYVGGLLHAKTLTVDGELTLIGSANMDRRSFELNYENNVLLVDRALTESLRQRQQTFIESSRPVTLEEVELWPPFRRLWNNTVAMLGPAL